MESLSRISFHKSTILTGKDEKASQCCKYLVFESFDRLTFADSLYSVDDTNVLKNNNSYNKSGISVLSMRVLLLVAGEGL